MLISEYFRVCFRSSKCQAIRHCGSMFYVVVWCIWICGYLDVCPNIFYLVIVLDHGINGNCQDGHDNLFIWFGKKKRTFLQYKQTRIPSIALLLLKSKHTSSKCKNFKSEIFQEYELVVLLILLWISKCISMIYSFSSVIYKRVFGVSKV